MTATSSPAEISPRIPATPLSIGPLVRQAMSHQADACQARYESRVPMQWFPGTANGRRPRNPGNQSCTNAGEFAALQIGEVTTVCCQPYTLDAQEPVAPSHRC